MKNKLRNWQRTGLALIVVCLGSLAVNSQTSPQSPPQTPRDSGTTSAEGRPTRRQTSKQWGRQVNAAKIDEKVGAPLHRGGSGGKNESERRAVRMPGGSGGRRAQRRVRDGAVPIGGRAKAACASPRGKLGPRPMERHPPVLFDGSSENRLSG